MSRGVVCKNALSALEQSIQSNRVHQTEIYLELLSTPHIDKSVSLSFAANLGRSFRDSTICFEAIPAGWTSLIEGMP
jgi:hypothetical protein